MKQTMGRYRGVDYVRQRICDVLAVPTRAQWYFVYHHGQPTGDHFRTLTELKQWASDTFNERTFKPLEIQKTFFNETP